MDIQALSQETDSGLVAGAIAGNKAAFSLLVERYVSPIYKFSYRYVRNGPDAEDVSQETFLRVWKNLDKFEQDKNFKTWIFTIAKNVSLDFLKRRKSTPFSVLGEGDDAVDAILAPYVAVTDTSEDSFDRGLLKGDFDTALAQLPERYREVMVLRYTDNLKFREIADRLHEPVDTVKSRHRRGLALLRDIIAPSPAPDAS